MSNTYLKSLAGSFATIALATTPLTAIGTMPARAAGPAAPIYGGGATLPELVYRQLFNCFGSTSGGDLTVGVASVTDVCASAINPSAELLYTGVGSTNGRAALVNNNPQKLTLNPGARTPDNPPV